MIFGTILGLFWECIGNSTKNVVNFTINKTNNKNILFLNIQSKIAKIIIKYFLKLNQKIS